MSPGEAAMAELLIDTILVLCAGAAIGALIALLVRSVRAVMRLRAAIRGELDRVGEWPHGCL